MTEFGCIEHDELNDRGYGRAQGRAAHVIAWEAVHGALPAIRVLDHTCNNRACKALHHLEPVTQRENLLRRDYAYRTRIKTCPRGHDITGVNAMTTPHGGRVCRACLAEIGR